MIIDEEMYSELIMEVRELIQLEQKTGRWFVREILSCQIISLVEIRENQVRFRNYIRQYIEQVEIWI